MAAGSKIPVNSVVGAVAAVIVAARAKDVRHIPRAILDEDGTIGSSVKMWSTAIAIFGYEKLIAAILRKLKLTSIPSTLAAMLSLFAILRTTQKTVSKEAADKLSALLAPGVNFLGKWMGCFLAPPLVSLDASIAALPKYGQGVWANMVALLFAGWSATHMAAGAVASSLAPKKVLNGPATAAPAQASTAVATKAGAKDVVPLDEAIRRAWVIIGATSYLGVACSSMLPAVLHRPIGMMCQASTTIGGLAVCKLLPDGVQKVLHPLVICAVTSNLASRFVGPAAPYFNNGVGVGDLLFKWLNAAVTGLGVRMYNTTNLWLDNPDDFKCVLATCTVSGLMSLGGTALLGSASPLSVPAPLSLPLLHRSVMSALGIEGSKAVGPECDPKLAVASILITGCIGASLGKSLLELCPKVFDTSSPLVRGLSMGCSAHSIGTAGLISMGDTEAAAISGASMCLAGTVHTILLSLPGVVPTIRKMAALPPLA